MSFSSLCNLSAHHRHVRRGMSVGLLIFLVATSVAQAQVGKRTKLTGEKATPKIGVGTTPTVSVGSLHITKTNAMAWKNANLDPERSLFPKGDSLYLVGNFTGENVMLKTEISKRNQNIRIVEETSNSLVIYTSQQHAATLAQDRTESWLDFLEPLTPARKLTPSLQAHIAKVLQTSPEAPVSPSGKSTTSPKPLLIRPEGTSTVAATNPAVSVVTPLANTATVDVTLYLFNNQSDVELRALVAKSGGKVVSAGKDETINVVRATLPATQVENVAASSSVREVTLDPKFIKHNDVAMKILTRNPPAFVPTIFGEGQVVGHSDSGLDIGKNDNSLHPAFRGRVKKAFALGRPGTSDWSDRGGHGSHTAGSILGNAAPFPGIAPKADLVHQSLDNEDGALAGIPTPLGKLFQQAFDEGARVHSNSWGVPAIDQFGNNTLGGEYLDGEEVDSWSWNNGSPRDMLVVFSAGNNGDHAVAAGKMTVTAPGTAKNCLTVGASENFRPLAGAGGDNEQQLASFSSQGPTKENRIKPDVVAPGTWIASVKTQAEQVVWENDVESVTVTPNAATSWQATAGFQDIASPVGGAFNGIHAWRLNRAMAATFQDILTTPEVTIPAGHELHLEVWLRGDITGLDRLRLGYRTPTSAFVFSEVSRRQFSGWTVVSAPIPRELVGTSARFLLVAEEAGGLPAGGVTLFIDQFKLTTFASWDALSSVALATADNAIDRQFTLSGGTSMAAPIVAGGAALVRQSLVGAGTAAPSAELVKAILINSADAHSGSRPNFRTGWGLVNLRRAIEGDYEFDFETRLANGEDKPYNISIPAGIKELRVTLVWPDSPQAKLVNDLDLTIKSPTGETFSASDPDDNSPDRTNNVEGIDRPNPVSGNWTVNVKAHKVSTGVNQPFAIVISKIP